MKVTFTNFSSDMTFEVPLDSISGVERYEEGGSLVQHGHGMYYMVRESVIDVMRLCVAAADAEQRARQDHGANS